jgi:hypothetical protein
MAKASKFLPFPPLSWDGWYWRGQWDDAWCAGQGAVELIVNTALSTSATKTKDKEAPPPTAAQAAAFEELVAEDSPVQQVLLAAFHKYLPELEDANWDAVLALLEAGSMEAGNVVVFSTALDDAAYLGFVFYSMEYEHGVGIVTHRQRLVHVGTAEEVDESIAEKDIRRHNRGKAGGK